MAFQRPTLAQIISRIEVDLVSRLELAGAVLRRAMVYVLSRVIAGAVHMLYGYLDFLARQLFADKSEDEFLVRQGSLFIGAKIAAGYAQAEVEITGDNGTVIPINTVLLSPAGYEYETQAEVTITSGTATATVEATLAGSLSTLVDDLILAFQSPISGANSTATVTDTIQDGSDEETTEEYRARLIAYLADPVHGGTSADYVLWAKEVSGVTRVWVTPLENGPGTVVVRFARDDDADPIPSAGEVAAVQAKLDEKKPAHATVTAFAPADFPIDFTLSITPDTSDLRAAVMDNLRDVILQDGEPGGTIVLAKLTTAIGATAGITDYTLTTPSGAVVATTNQLPSLGDFTWT